MTKIYLSTYSAIAIFKYEIITRLTNKMFNLDDVKLLLNSIIKHSKKRDTTLDVNIQYNFKKLKKKRHQHLKIFGRFGRAVKKDLFKMGPVVHVTVLEFPAELFDLKQFKQSVIQRKPWRDNEIYWEGLTQKHVDNFFKTRYSDKDLDHDLNKIKKMLNLK